MEGLPFNFVNRSVYGKKDTLFLNGLKGIACLSVFIHHFMLAFFPASYYRNTIPSHLFYNIDCYISYSPLSFIINGEFMVNIFLLISAFIFANKFIKLTHNESVLELSKTIIKRYFRIVGPVFIVSIFVYLIWNLSLFKHIDVSLISGSPWLASYYNDIPSIKDIFVSSFVRVPFFGNNVFSNAFWMLKYVFIGTLMSIIVIIILKHLKERYRLGFLMTLILLLYDSYYFVVILGAFLSFIANYKSMAFLENSCVGIILIILGIILGGYPTGTQNVGVYTFLQKLHFSSLFYYSLGSFMFVFGCFKIKMIKTFLSHKILQVLGKISFAIYLLHIPLLFSFGMIVFLKIYSLIGGYMTSVFITFIALSILLILISILFYKYIEHNLYKYINKFICVIFE